MFVIHTNKKLLHIQDIKKNYLHFIILKYQYLNFGIPIFYYKKVTLQVKTKSEEKKLRIKRSINLA